MSACRPQIHLDMDDVCCDFIGSALDLHGIKRADALKRWPAGEWFVPSAVMELSRFKPLGFIEGVDAHGGKAFWENLPPTPWFKDLYTGLHELGDVHILSAPTGHPDCKEGKLAWLERHAVPTPRSVILSPEKERYAGPNSILIDDRDANLDRFRAAGGAGVLVPQFNNSGRDRWRFEGSVAGDILAATKRVIETQGRMAQTTGGARAHSSDARMAG